MGVKEQTSKMTLKLMLMLVIFCTLHSVLSRPDTDSETRVEKLENQGELQDVNVLDILGQPLTNTRVKRSASPRGKPRNKGNKKKKNRNKTKRMRRMRNRRMRRRRNRNRKRMRRN